MPAITLMGLGPGNPVHLTREAWDTLQVAREIYVRTCQHPTVNELPSHLVIHSFDPIYETADTFEEVYDQIVAEILTLGKREQGVIYAVPGDPFVAEATCPEIARLGQEQGIPIRVINGLSFLEPVFTALAIDPLPHLFILDALEIGQEHIATFPPDRPVLIAQIYSKMIAAEVKATLNTVFPDEHPVVMVHSAGMQDQIVERLKLFEIDRSDHVGLTTVLYIPPLGKGTSFESFQEVVAHLRAPQGCPWDREQTYQSMRPHLLEETYEVLAAVDDNDNKKMLEELGDLLLQIVMYIQMANEAGDFTMTDVLLEIRNKLIRRHPHVFSDVEISDVPGVLRNWEKIKSAERGAGGKSEGLLDGVPITLPALSQAQEYQERAARVGFDWKVMDGVLDKIIEEIGELRVVRNADQLSAELGDLFFSLVNLARWKKIDAETALREANSRFGKRFSLMEKYAWSAGKELSGMDAEELDTLWEKAKKNEKK